MKNPYFEGKNQILRRCVVDKNTVRKKEEVFGKDLGLIHEAIITGRKVGAGKDFWVKLAHDENLFSRTVEFVNFGGYPVEYNTDKFFFMKEFALTIPADYNHSHRLDTFKRAHQKKFYYYNENITDKNFQKVSHQIVPGKTYKVKVFGSKNSVTSNECLAVYLANKAYLTGAQGASAVYEYAKDQLIKGKWNLSFDEKDNLWVDAYDYHRVPRVRATSGGTFHFNLGYFESDWRDNVLLVLCD